MLTPKDVTKDLVNEIWDDDYYIVAAGDDAPSKEEVIEFGKSFGVTFPDDYLAHSTGRMGGFFITVKEEVWPHAEEFEVGPFWMFLRGVYSYAYSEDAPDWLNIAVAADHYEEMGHKVVPVFKIWSDADVYCYNEQGKLVRYLNAEDTFEDVDKTWFDMIRYELGELAKRKKMKLESSS
ncbi:MAG: hypothetical protein ACPG8W_12650 [Candidatus Promineifilaceae bacterium]